MSYIEIPRLNRSLKLRRLIVYGIIIIRQQLNMGEAGKYASL